MATIRPSMTSAEGLVEGFALGPFATNCYIVRAGDAMGEREACWLVDASWGAGDMARRALDAGLEPQALILTHAHVDHIAGVGEVREVLPDLPILIHPSERAWLGDPTKNLSAALDGEPVTAPEATGTLEHGQTLELGERAWKVLHTPGHSPGGVTLHEPGLGVALAGDTLFAGSIGRFDFPTSDEDALMRSIRETLYALPDETEVLPGHGPGTTIGREKATNPFVRG